MKNKIIISLLLLMGFTAAKAQFPFNQTLGNPQTQVYTKGGMGSDSGFVWRTNFADTIAANRGFLDGIPGIVIRTGNLLWQRNQAATAWILIASSININNFIQNFNDSTFYNINDSTILFCVGIGAARVCDTIHLGNSNTFYITVTGDTLITCDTFQIICPTPDSCFQQQVCDTIVLAQAIPVPIYQNGVRIVPNTTVREHGQPYPGEGSQAQLVHDTWLYTNAYDYTTQGRPADRPVTNVKNSGWTQTSSSISSWNHYGAYRPGWGLLDSSNVVNLYINYTDPFIIPETGPVAGDTLGFMGNRYGYLLMTNSKGRQGNYLIDDYDAKQVGLFFDTYSQNNEGVSIFAQQLPSDYNFHANPAVDSTLLSKRVAIFKTNQQLQLPAYTSSNTALRSSDTTNFKPAVMDANGNVYRSFWLGAGGAVDTNFIRNQTFQQPSSNFNISGSGHIETNLRVNGGIGVGAATTGSNGLYMISKNYYQQGHVSDNSEIIADFRGANGGQRVSIYGGGLMTVGYSTAPTQQSNTSIFANRLFIGDNDAGYIHIASYGEGASTDYAVFQTTESKSVAGTSGFDFLTSNAGSSKLGFRIQANGNSLTNGNFQLAIDADDGTPVTPTLKSGDGGGTDHDGAGLIIESGAPTGNALSGDIAQKTVVPSTSSGSTLRTDYGDRARILSKYTALTESTATAFVRVNIPTGTAAGGEIWVTVEADDATDFQSRTLSFLYTAVNKAGTTTVTIETPREVAAVSSGTLTVTITAVDSGSGNIDFKANAVSSLTQTSLKANCQVNKNMGSGNISAQ